MSWVPSSAASSPGRTPAEGLELGHQADIVGLLLGDLLFLPGHFLLQIFDCIILFFSSFVGLLRIVFRGGLLLHFRFLDLFLFVFLCHVSVGLDGKDRNK